MHSVSYSYTCFLASTWTKYFLLTTELMGDMGLFTVKLFTAKYMVSKPVSYLSTLSLYSVKQANKTWLFYIPANPFLFLRNTSTLVIDHISGFSDSNF